MIFYDSVNSFLDETSGMDIPFGEISLEQTQVGFPLVSNDFATRKTTNRNDHLYRSI